MKASRQGTLLASLPANLSYQRPKGEQLQEILEGVDLTDVSLYSLLAERWGARVASADQWASAVRLTEEEAGILGVDAGQPALLFQRVTRDQPGNIVEYVRSVYRGDRYEVHHRLERIEGTEVSARHELGTILT